MASGKSAYLEKTLLDLVFGATPWTPPVTFYVALSTEFFDTLNGPTEPVGNNYSRSSVANDTSSWAAASGTPTTKTNSVDIVFPNPTAGWGTIKSIYVMDSLTVGNWLYGGDLTTLATIVAGTAPSFSAGDLLLREF